MPIERSPVLTRRKPAALLGEQRLQGHAPRSPQTACGPKIADEETSKNESESVDLDEDTEILDKTSNRSKSGMEQASDRPSKVGKLDDSAYKPFGSGSISSLSRSSSDTGSEEAICNGGPGKTTCGNPVKVGELGIRCDCCQNWFHAACQAVPKPAVKACERYVSLAWLCTTCKAELKKNKTQPPHTKELEGKFSTLETTVCTQMRLVSESLLKQEQSMKGELDKVGQAVLECHKHLLDQASKIEKMTQKQKASYAEAVKGTSDELVNAVKSQLETLPKLQQGTDQKSFRELSHAIDDHMDRERRKANLVVHNLPEQAGDSLADRSKNDIALFTTMVREVMKLNVTASKSFRAGKKTGDRPRLLIVSLDNPASKFDVLRHATELRNSDEYQNIYVTPDLTPKEREANRILREELAVRKKAGEANLMIRKGRIVQVARSAPAPVQVGAPASASGPATAGDSHPRQSTGSGTHVHQTPANPPTGAEQRHAEGQPPQVQDTTEDANNSAGAGGNEGCDHTTEADNAASHSSGRDLPPPPSEK